MEKPTNVSSPLAGSAGRAGIDWWKSSYSNPQGTCVEVAEPLGPHVWFRDSKTGDGPVITVSRRSAAVFTSAVARGEV
ncbi:DUF397 domain-containing protein [Streptomyces prunicolor]|uniref:DUF397 domain-containing protein n=1 Tax=Streptomyces prunicolor TaxID=67348 RepID=UPI0033E0A8B1